MPMRHKDFRFSKQYLIIGSNNFWYASCLRSKKEALAELKYIKSHHSEYCDPETGHQPSYPDKFYVYRAAQINLA